MKRKKITIQKKNYNVKNKRKRDKKFNASQKIYWSLKLSSVGLSNFVITEIYRVFLLSLDTFDFEWLCQFLTFFNLKRGIESFWDGAFDD